MRLSSKYTPEISQPFSTDTQSEQEELKNLVEIYRQRLENQWADLKENAAQYGKQALVIGGVLLTAYLLLEALLPKNDEKEEVKEEELKVIKPKKEAGFSIGGAIQGLAWTLAANWAQQKLIHYMQEDQGTNAQIEE
jgi:hypothetical protein